MKTEIIILIYLITFSINSFACECSEFELDELDKKSYEWSEVILIGDVIRTGTNYQIRITELLKGKVESAMINGTIYSQDSVYNTCTGFPSLKGEYLFYLNKIQRNGKTFYLYSQCLGTRRTDMELVIIPLRTNKTKSELIVATEKWIAELRKRKK